MRLLAFASVCALTFNSCKKDDNQTPEDNIEIEAPAGKTAAISAAHYEWGDLSLSPKIYDDVITYNTAGQIEKVTLSGGINQTIDVTYSGHEITLNTPFKDVFELDNQGRVVLHTSTQVQHDFIFMHTEQYNYDANGYLTRVSLSLNGTEYSKILYEVKNGNYTRYALQNSSDGRITREYQFTYSKTNTTSAFALFTPVFSNNTLATVEKYLNFGKQSVNVLSTVNYKIISLDNTTKSGSLTVKSNLNAEKNIIDFELVGDAIAGVPADNLSPLPRRASFELAK